MKQNQEEGYMRDEYSNAVVCADNQKKDRFMRKRKEQQRIKRLEDGFEAMKDDVKVIKETLVRLLAQKT